MYFKTTNKINNSVNNIAYKNATCKEVSTSIRTLLGKSDEYEIGEKLICREYFKSLKTTYNVNYEYEITDVNEKYLTIKEVHSTEESTVPLSSIRSKFIFNYCATCHSLQGSSVSGPVTIFDWNHYFVDKKWLWTAITRATNLDDLYFYDYVSTQKGEDQRGDEEVKMDSELKQYFNKKISGYKTQDQNAKRPISNNYITVDWCLNNFKSTCVNCNCAFEYENGKSNFTAQRLDNALDHNLDNIIPMCKLCNCSLK